MEGQFRMLEQAVVSLYSLIDVSMVLTHYDYMQVVNYTFIT